MKWKAKMLMLMWFSGITGFFLVSATIFLEMMPGQHEKIIIYEPNNLIFWAEITMIIFILGFTLWILYNYISGRGTLELIKKTSR